MDIHPKLCNLCGGPVEYTSNAKIYGRQFGSGFCYRCLSCGAYVGTHEPRPDEAMGLLADQYMRKLKVSCHEIFDSMWKTSDERSDLYKKLAAEMNIKLQDCHFGHFDRTQLETAYEILKRWRDNGRKYYSA